MMQQKLHLGEQTQQLIYENVSLHDKNWFGTGGAAQFFCTPTTSAAFCDALTFAHQHNIPVALLGQGANVLISDDGFDGLVIQPALTDILLEHHAHDCLVTAGSGALMSDLINFCLAHNVIGLEEFSGIPGTVGGAVYINLHYFEFLIEQFLVKADVIDCASGAIQTVDKDWFDFSYNHSTLHQRTHFLLNATFKVHQTTAAHTDFARGRQHEIIRHRARRYPTSGTCGSFFRAFHDNEVTLTINNKKMIYVGYYLDKVGIKGALSVGDAIVSYQHANMIVNQGAATSADIIALARTMQELVFKEFGILPQPECELIGFKEYPLLKQIEKSL